MVPALAFVDLLFLLFIHLFVHLLDKRQLFKQVEGIGWNTKYCRADRENDYCAEVQIFFDQGETEALHDVQEDPAEAIAKDKSQHEVPVGEYSSEGECSWLVEASCDAKESEDHIRKIQ